jgi:hypothetical protein
MRLKVANDPSQKMNAFQAQLRARVYTVNGIQATRRLTEEAMTAFNAKGGAVFWNDEKEPSYTCGTWDGEVQLRAAVASSARQYGIAALGARRNGHPYDERDRATLEQAASFVAQVIEQDNPAALSHPIS